MFVFSVYDQIFDLINKKDLKVFNIVYKGLHHDKKFSRKAENVSRFLNLIRILIQMFQVLDTLKISIQ